MLSSLANVTVRFPDLRARNMVRSVENDFSSSVSLCLWQVVQVKAKLCFVLISTERAVGMWVSVTRLPLWSFTAGSALQKMLC